MLRLRSIRHKLMSVVLLTTLVALVISLGTIVVYDLRAITATWWPTSVPRPSCWGT